MTATIHNLTDHRDNRLQDEIDEIVRTAQSGESYLVWWEKEIEFAERICDEFNEGMDIVLPKTPLPLPNKQRGGIKR